MKTKAQLFIAKAQELMPYQSELRQIDPAIDSYALIDSNLYSQSEYLGGMATVIISLLEQEEQ